MLHRIRNSPRLTIRSTPIYQRIPLPIRLLSSTPAEQLSPLERFSRIPSWKILAALGTAVGIVLIPTWWQSEEEAVPAEHYALLLSECCAAADEVVERATAATLRCIRELMSEIGENATGDNDARVAEAFNKLLQARSLAIEEVFSKVRQDHGISAAAEAVAASKYSDDPLIERLRGHIHNTLSKGLLGELPDDERELITAATASVGETDISEACMPVGMDADKFVAIFCDFTAASAADVRWMVQQTDRYKQLSKREKMQLIAPLAEDASRAALAAVGLSRESFRACAQRFRSDPRVVAEIERSKRELDEIIQPLQVPKTAADASAAEN